MKIFHIFLVVFLVAFLSLVSCTNTDTPTDNTDTLTDNTDNTWITGFWVDSHSYAPYTDVIDFNADGNYYNYDNYDITGFLSSGTWSLNGDILTFNGVPYAIEKVDNNQFLLMGEYYNRRGNEPGGNIFNHTVPILIPSTIHTEYIMYKELQLYSITAQSDNDYTIRWNYFEEFYIGYIANIIVSAYKADQITPFFVECDNRYFSQQTVTLSQDEKIYIIVEAYSEGMYEFMIIG